MTRKRTLSDFALWAALPMAHTSKIENRLHRILDSTRHRALPRRALVFGAAVGAAVLVPLAMLRPVAKAQSSFMESSYTATFSDGRTMTLIGLTELNCSQAKNEWHSPTGVLLPRPASAIPYGWSPGPLKRLVRSYLLVFRLSPQTRADASFVYEVPSAQGVSTAPKKAQPSGLQMLGLLYDDKSMVKSAPLVKVGMASGAWKAAGSNAMMGLLGAGGYNSQGISYLFGPLKSEGHGCSQTVTVVSPFNDYRLTIVDKQGRVRMPVQEDSADSSDHLHYAKQMTAHFDVPASQVHATQVESRPFQWAEFKNVALQPVK